MKSTTLRRGLKTVAVLVCLSAAPALASVSLFHEHFYAHIYGVDGNGNLSYTRGVDTGFDASINTATGRYVGTSRDVVENDTDHRQSYVNVHSAFIYGQIVISHSLYLVDSAGNATLVADGNVTNAPS